MQLLTTNKLATMPFRLSFTVLSRKVASFFSSVSLKTRQLTTSLEVLPALRCYFRLPAVWTCQYRVFLQSETVAVIGTCIRFLSIRQPAELYSFTPLHDHSWHCSRPRAQSFHTIVLRIPHAEVILCTDSKKVRECTVYDMHRTAFQTSPARQTARAAFRLESTSLFSLAKLNCWGAMCFR